MDREAWRAAIHGVARSRTWLSDWTELNWCCLIIHFKKASRCCLKLYLQCDCQVEGFVRRPMAYLEKGLSFIASQLSVCKGNCGGSLGVLGLSGRQGSDGHSWGHMWAPRSLETETGAPSLETAGCPITLRCSQNNWREEDKGWRIGVWPKYTFSGSPRILPAQP